MILDSVPDHVLYRMYNAADELVYVGATQNARGRIGNHKDGKWWWPNISKITLERYTTREELIAAELAEIRTHQPRYNIANNPRYIYPSSACAKDDDHICDDCEECYYAWHYLREEESEMELLKVLLAPCDEPRSA